jgi:hypothetical protein
MRLWGETELFGIFKKKPTAMDGMIRAIYGDNPPAKSADLKRDVFGSIRFGIPESGRL